jgi:hypothetical protein
MADLMTTDLPPSDATQRRRRRIERELRALHAMDGHLQTKEIVGALLIIPALAGLCFAVAYKLHMTSASLPAAIAGAIAFGAALWWIGRRWFVIAVLMVYGLVLILFEDLPDFGDFGGGPKGKPSRRAKLEQAVARREALLRKLGEAKA